MGSLGLTLLPPWKKKLSRLFFLNLFIFSLFSIFLCSWPLTIYQLLFIRHSLFMNRTESLPALPIYGLRLQHMGLSDADQRDQMLRTTRIKNTKFILIVMRLCGMLFYLGMSGGLWRPCPPLMNHDFKSGREFSNIYKNSYNLYKKLRPTISN